MRVLTFVKWIAVVKFLALTIPVILFANSWQEHLNSIKADAIEEGIRPELILDAINKAKKPRTIVKKLEKSQPEKRITFLKYRASRIDSYRIHLGKKAYRNNHKLLEKIAARYKVDPAVIIAIWGIETSYGHFKGKHPVIPSLATLAYTSKRKDFFHKELMYAFKIVNEGHIALKDFVGEWAGGSGHPQFLPSSWNYYSEDFDGDGKRDIWEHKADALASIANYLKQHNWQYKQPWMTEVIIKNKALKYDKLKTWKNVAAWKSLGVVAKGNAKFPSDDTKAAILVFEEGPSYLIYQNFKSIMSYNRSTFYAAAVGYLSSSIA